MKYLYLGLLSFLLIGYQNCGKSMEFSSNSATDLVKISENGDLEPSDLVEIPIEESDVNNNDEPPSSGHSCDKNKDKDKAKLGFICILEGSGKSQKLALDGSLLSKNATAKTICTTEKACLEIASMKFNVISAEYRGYCKNDKAHSVALDENQLLELVNK